MTRNERFALLIGLALATLGVVAFARYAIAGPGGGSHAATNATDGMPYRWTGTAPAWPTPVDTFWHTSGDTASYSGDTIVIRFAGDSSATSRKLTSGCAIHGTFWHTMMRPETVATEDTVGAWIPTAESVFTLDTLVRRDTLVDSVWYGDTVTVGAVETTWARDLAHQWSVATGSYATLFPIPLTCTWMRALNPTTLVCTYDSTYTQDTLNVADSLVFEASRPGWEGNPSRLRIRVREYVAP